MRHHRCGTWEKLATEERWEQAARERSQEAEAVVLGLQEAPHPEASPRAHLCLIARLQIRILRSQVQEVVAVEVGL